MSMPFPWLPTELDMLASSGLRRARRIVQPLPGGACKIDGKRLWNFSSNDYLGLAGDSRLAEAAKTALAECGVGARASALVTGRTAHHEQLEQELARFERQPAAILFPTGYAANVGTIAALVGDDDVVFCDRLNHASLIDGCRLSGAKLRVFRHAELETLERELQKSAEFRRRLIVTDAVFSMDGDLAPLRELCDLAERFDADLLVDEAHGTGVFGDHGRGVCEHFGVEDRVAVRVGTLSKAIGTLGGFVAGPQALIDWLWNKARPQIFSTALPPALCAAATAAVTILETEPDLRQRLWRNCEFVRRELASRGINVLAHSTGPILPIMLGDPESAVLAQERLEERSYHVAAIRPPTVPQGTSRLRISLSAAHDDAALSCLVDALREVVPIP
jgi:8-amino-7-oxononanoate synthase